VIGPRIVGTWNNVGYSIVGNVDCKGISNLEKGSWAWDIAGEKVMVHYRKNGLADVLGTEEEGKERLAPVIMVTIA
jgi:hypothetical protein